MKELELKGARTRLGLTQRDLAQRIGMSEGSYQKRESKVQDFKLNDVAAIAMVLGLKMQQVNDIFFDGNLPA